MSSLYFTNRKDSPKIGNNQTNLGVGNHTPLLSHNINNQYLTKTSLSSISSNIWKSSNSSQKLWKFLGSSSIYVEYVIGTCVLDNLGTSQQEKSFETTYEMMLE